VRAAGGRYALLAEERRAVYSPAWLIPYDDFRRRPSTDGLRVELDRWDGAAWTPADVAALRTPGGVIAYPGLGRRSWPAEPGPQLYRSRLAGPGLHALYLAENGDFYADRVGVEFLAFPYDDEHPPEILAQPQLVRLLPGPSFGFPPGTRVVRGVVRRAETAQPVANALVESRGQAAPDGVDWYERALSGPDGAFRLSLRWPGEAPEDRPHEQTFRLTATESPDRTGALVIRLPDDLYRVHVVEIS
jgi:hypothetical protein